MLSLRPAGSVSLAWRLSPFFFGRICDSIVGLVIMMLIVIVIAVVKVVTVVTNHVVGIAVVNSIVIAIGILFIGLTGNIVGNSI